jgi:hypothetical protein
MGGCLPKPKVINAASITSSNQGPDLSNNNPVYSAASWAAIGRHNAFEIDKVSEGTGYADPTAAPMAREARAHGVVVGGYDFLHVCLDAPASEADLFVSRLKADGIVGGGTLPPTGDAEYPSAPACNVRTWISGWADRVHSLLGRWPQIYTGAWWWNPHVGVWWLPHALAWVSGYTSWAFLPHPSGRSQVDLWQFSDHGWNGATTSDLSVWRDGAKAFAAATGVTTKAKPKPYAVFPLKRVRLYGHLVSERLTVHAWDRQKCRNPVRRGYCRLLHKRLVQLRGRLDHIAHHPLKHGKPTYRLFHRGARRAQINRRINHR